MAGYTRQSAADIAPTQIVKAAPLNLEFDTLSAAFNGTTGHAHDGGTGNGPRISLTTSVTGILPVANGGTGSATGYGADLVALEALSGTGFATRTAADTWTTRTLTAPAAGITITNPAGIAGNPTFALANDLSGVEGLATNGIAVRTATDTWTTRAVAGTTAEITVTNGDGVSGAPTISLPTALTFTGKTVTGGTFNGATIQNPNASNLVTVLNSGEVTVKDTVNSGTAAVTFFALRDSANASFLTMGRTVAAGIPTISGAPSLVVNGGSSGLTLQTSGNGNIDITPAGTGTLTATVGNSILITSNASISIVNNNSNIDLSNPYSNTGSQAGWSRNGNIIRTSVTSTATTNHYGFYNTNGLVGGIQTSGTGTVFNATSDQTLKKDFSPLDAGEIIDNLNTYNYKWKSDNKAGVGVKAQEAYEVFPDAVSPAGYWEDSETFEHYSEDGPNRSYVPWMVDYSKFVPLLLAEVKSLRARVAELEGK